MEVLQLPKSRTEAVEFVEYAVLLLPAEEETAVRPPKEDTRVPSLPAEDEGWRRKNDLALST